MDKLLFQDLTLSFCSQVHDIEMRSICQPWSFEQIQELIDDKNAVARVGIIDNCAVCYYSFYNICGEAYVNNLAVGMEFRGRGIGNLLIEDMISVARSIGMEGITLEVNENNTVAIALYNKHGFKVEGRRAKFYEGKDDALIMWKREL